MKRWLLEDSVKAFINSDITTIKKHTLEFAQKITKAILDNDKDEMEGLIDASAHIRDNVEFSEEINRNKEFYYGYWYAYDNIANRIVDNDDTNENIHAMIESNEKLRILVKFLGVEKAARQKDIANHLGIKPNELANFMETDYVKKSDVLSKNKIGRNVIYSLNPKGRKYFKDQTSKVRNNYSKNDIFTIIEYIKKGNIKDEMFSKSCPGLDESILIMIRNLLISKQALENSKYKIDIYRKYENITESNKPANKPELKYSKMSKMESANQSQLLSA